MNDHLVIDASRQPSQIRCLHCGAAQDLALPMWISELVILEEAWRKQHGRCTATAPFVPTHV
jgi:hypothetical protein